MTGICKQTLPVVFGVVICLGRGADLHTAQLMPLPLTVTCFSKIQTGLPFWYRLTWVVPEKGPLNVCVLPNCIYFYENVGPWAVWLHGSCCRGAVTFAAVKVKMDSRVLVWEPSIPADLGHIAELTYVLIRPCTSCWQTVCLAPDLQNISWQCYDNAKVATDVSFTKHFTKDARLFSGAVHLQNRLRQCS